MIMTDISLHFAHSFFVPVNNADTKCLFFVKIVPCISLNVNKKIMNENKYILFEIFLAFVCEL